MCGTAYLQSAGHVCPLGGSTEKSDDGLEGAVIDDRYRIDKMLSKGGMGMVYQATHTVLDKPLAFKVMLQPQDEAARQRFLLEAKLAVQVRHRNIVDVVDFGVLSTNQPFLVMEFLVGQTLAELIEQGPIPPARMCFLASQVACGLGEVHRKGIVHRDLKPAKRGWRRGALFPLPWTDGMRSGNSHREGACDASFADSSTQVWTYGQAA